MNEHGYRVLLVEDDLLVRSTIEALLEDVGYMVTAAASANAGIGMLEEGVEGSAVVTDDVMPGFRTGLDLGLEIRRRWPEIGVVLISGTRSAIAGRRGCGS